MKHKLSLTGLLIATAFFACQNKQSTRQNTDTLGMAAEHVTDSSQSRSSDSASMMNSMDRMMNEMHKLEKTGNTDHDLALSMKAHHDGAIDMAKMELKSGKDEQLRAMAQSIVNKQSAEASELDNLAEKYKNAPKNYDPSDDKSGLGKFYSDDMNGMMQPLNAGRSTDQQFAILMSKHHKSGVAMAKAIQQYAQDSMFKSMASKMIEDQGREIKELDSWIGSNK